MKRLSHLILSIAVVSMLFPACVNADAKSNTFKAILVDYKTKSPISDARIILAKKTKDTCLCVIDTSLTALSNERGEIHISNVAAGEYVIFYNSSGIVHSGLNGKVVPYYNRDFNDSYTKSMSNSLGTLSVLAGSQIGVVDGLIAPSDGYIYAADFDLAMVLSKGKLLHVLIPNPGSTPMPIELNTEFKKGK